MRALLAFITLVFLAFSFSACSSNRVFEPEHITGDRDLEDGYDEELFMQHREGVTYEDGAILTKKGLFTHFKLPEGFAYLNESETMIIAADNGGRVLIKAKEGKEETYFDFNGRVLSAVLEDDLLATVNVRNEMKVFSLVSKEELYTFSGSPVMAIDVRLASPRFYEGLIFFPTLDGKIQIYSHNSKKMIRTMSVSTEDQFNNIIFFEIVDTKIVAATGTKIYLFGKNSYQKNLPIRELFLNGDSIVVLRKDGRITSLDFNLEAIHEKKYKYAYFLGGMSKENIIYVVEKEGYLLKLSKDFSLSLVYELDFESDYFFVGKESFYFSDGYYTP